IRAMEGARPYPYQERLAIEDWPDMVDIPTGLGKTAAISLAWLYKRGWRAEGKHGSTDEQTPRRLVWCLPMRVLVEQTETNLRNWLERLGVLGEPGEVDRVAVHVLMGGEVGLQRASWAVHPEQDAVLIGTQDMLLSRALMRGYGMSRYQWPVHYGALHNDVLWVFDEVQLMGPALATTTQLEAFRRRLGVFRCSRSIWCSATLQPDWLATVDFRPAVESGLSRLALDDNDRRELAVTRRTRAAKTIYRAAPVLGKLDKATEAEYIRELAKQILEHHQTGEQTLVILNRVERAQALFEALAKWDDSPDRLLLHARFRPHERRDIESRLRQAPAGTGRIVIATQAVEAGVDIDSRVMFTELAPWSSLVQRFGRCNRGGDFEQATIFWIDLDETARDVALPYEPTHLGQARERLAVLASAAPDALPAVERGPETPHVLRRRDFLNLFNTDPDLSGFDIDVSPYIRDTGTPQVQVFWRDVPADRYLYQAEPFRDELCPASLTQIRAHLARRFPANIAGRIKRERPSAWRLDPLGSGEGARWERLQGPEDIRPGQVLLLATDEGGYDSRLGFRAGLHEPVVPVGQLAESAADDVYASDNMTWIGRRVPLAEHLDDVTDDVCKLGRLLNLDPDLQRVLETAARWHDIGKAHEAFQRGIGADPDDPDGPWAKSDGRGRPDYHVLDPEGRKASRRYFRHELVSMLAWLEHADPTVTPEERDLVAYLVAAHHGRVRMGLRALPGENEPPDHDRSFARGVWEGDRLPALDLGGETIPETRLRLDLMRLGVGPQGPSWSERTHRLLDELGPFRLAWLETLLRIADWRASAREEQGETS
ncbi:MAG: CRISPR-associated helicase Cas3', partial [Halothiobacillaceae bacterium]